MWTGWTSGQVDKLYRLDRLDRLKFAGARLQRVPGHIDSIHFLVPHIVGSHLLSWRALAARAWTY